MQQIQFCISTIQGGWTDRQYKDIAQVTHDNQHTLVLVQTRLDLDRIQTHALGANKGDATGCNVRGRADRDTGAIGGHKQKIRR